MDREHNNDLVIQVKKLPKVNRHLAEKLMAQTEDATIKKKKKVEAQNVLADDRFSAMFERPEFQVDMESDEYRLINPLVSQIDQVILFIHMKAIGALFIYWCIHSFLSRINDANSFNRILIE